MDLKYWVNEALTKVDWSGLGTVYAAVLSTILGIREIFTSRLKLFANLDTRITTDGDFCVNIISLYSKPIIINYYSFFLKEKDIDVGLYEACNIVIKPNAVNSIWFSEMYLADFGNTGELFVELAITGHSKKKIKVSR